MRGAFRAYLLWRLALHVSGRLAGVYRQQYIRSVYLAYNPSFSACFLSRNSIFSHNKSANSVFQSAYRHSRTGS
jgi:hypothetical protein